MPRERLNARCEWLNDTPARLDLHTLRGRRHLDEDVRIAEEVGLRYGDSFKGREWPGRRRQEACTAVLLATIATVHQVPLEEVVKARGRTDWPVTVVVVIVPMVLLVGAVANGLTSFLNRRLLPDRAIVALIMIVIAAVVTSTGMVAVAAVWEGVTQSIRRGDVHGSYRVAYNVSERYPLPLFLAANTIFGLVAVWRSWLP